MPATRRVVGPVAYTMVRHPVSGVELPRIRLPERPDVETGVNARLDSLAASLRCPDADGGEYDTRAAVTYARNDVFSVQIASSYYCGGAYPTHRADSSVTFDLRTGREVELRSLFADYERDRAEIARAFLGSLSAGDLEGCEDVLTAEEIDSFAFTISPEGLRLETAFPHVIEACNRESTVAFDVLRAFAAPGGILTRVADAAAPN
jgi:hypothetical protein